MRKSGFWYDLYHYFTLGEKLLWCGSVALVLGASAGVTAVFYFIMKAFGTANLALSTVSVLTSFLAVALTYKRSPLFALAYAANDVVLIGLWAAASFADPSYLSVTVCFTVFLVNDSYTYFNWRRLQKRQQK